MPMVGVSMDGTIVAVSSPLFTKLVATAELLTWMTESALVAGGFTNPVPVTTSVNEAVLIVPVMGAIFVMTGWVVTTVNVSGPERPPPGAVVLTTIEKSPGDNRSLAGTLAVRWLLSTKFVVSCWLFQRTVDGPLTN